MTGIATASTLLMPRRYLGSNSYRKTPIWLRNNLTLHLCNTTMNEFPLKGVIICPLVPKSTHLSSLFVQTFSTIILHTESREMDTERNLILDPSYICHICGPAFPSGMKLRNRNQLTTSNGGTIYLICLIENATRTPNQQGLASSIVAACRSCIPNSTESVTVPVVETLAHR
jgi:hypothetical protein